MVHCKRSVTLRSTAEWEKENTPTHTLTQHTEGIQQTLPKKGQKGQKKNKNKVNTVKNLKRGHNDLLQNSKPLLLRMTGKERKITMITSSRYRDAIILLTYSNFQQRHRTIISTQLDTICCSLICPQSRNLT